MVVLVCMVTWLSTFEKLNAENNYRVVELFAGLARVSKACLHVGYEAAAVDITYDEENPRTMDINSSAGFVYLVFV